METSSFGSEFIAARKLVLDVAYILYNIHLQQSFCYCFPIQKFSAVGFSGQVAKMNINQTIMFSVKRSQQWRIVLYYMYNIIIIQAFQAWSSPIFPLQSQERSTFQYLLYIWEHPKQNKQVSHHLYLCFAFIPYLPKLIEGRIPEIATL